MNIKKKNNLIQTLLLTLILLIVSPTLTMAAETPKEEKSNEVLAMEVILGDWGNGQERKDSLTKAGYEYQTIQDIVNSYYGILYDVSLPVENNTIIKQSNTPKVKQVTQVKKNENTRSEKIQSEKVVSEKVTNQKPVNKKPVSKKVVSKKVTSKKVVRKAVANKRVQSNRLYSLRDLQFHGVINWNGYKFTYYSQSVLPGGGLRIPGRHVNESGYVADKDGYIVLANDAPKGTVISTPFGYMGKVYDRGTYGNHFDVYTK